MDNAMAADGWTMTPNDYLDHMSELGNAELRVLLAITRKTIGYQKDTDVISFSQFEQITGLARQHVKGAIDSLLSRGLISRTDAKRSSFAYQLVTLGNQLQKVTSNEGLPEPVTLGNQSLVTLGSTQNKEKEISKEKELGDVSDDTHTPTQGAKKKTSPNRSPKVKAAAPADPPTPIEIRQAYAAVCDVDISPGAKPPAKMIALLNSEAKALWAQQQEQGIGALKTVRGVHETAAYTRATDWRYKDPAVRLPIGIIRENWTAARRRAKERAVSLNGHHVAAQEDESQYASLEEWQAMVGGGK